MEDGQKQKKEKFQVDEYLNGFKRDDSKSYNAITNIIKKDLSHSVLLKMLEAYEDTIEPRIIQRIHKRNLNCCWKLIEDNWEGFEKFLDNMVLVTENHEYMGKDSAINKIRDLSKSSE